MVLETSTVLRLRQLLCADRIARVRFVRFVGLAALNLILRSPHAIAADRCFLPKRKTTFAELAGGVREGLSLQHCLSDGRTRSATAHSRSARRNGAHATDCPSMRAKCTKISPDSRSHSTYHGRAFVGEAAIAFEAKPVLPQDFCGSKLVESGS